MVEGKLAHEQGRFLLFPCGHVAIDAPVAGKIAVFIEDWEAAAFHDMVPLFAKAGRKFKPVATRFSTRSAGLTVHVLNEFEARADGAGLPVQRR